MFSIVPLYCKSLVALAFQMLPQGLIALVNKFSKVRSAVAVY